MRKTFIVLFLMLFAFVGTSFTQTVKTEVYGNYGYGLDSAKFSGDLKKGESSFNVKDVFLGVDYGLTDNFSAGANLRYDGTKVNLYTADISYFTNISTDLDLEVSLGQTESYWYSYTNKIWNNYAIDNVISDKFGFVDRTKIGVSGKLVNKNVIGAVEISNGVNNRNKSYAFNLVLIPIENLKLAGIYNYRNLEDTLNASVFGGSAVYEFKTKKIGSFKFYGEYLQFKNIDKTVSDKQQAFTLFGEYGFNESPFSIVARYDRYFYGDNNAPAYQYAVLGLNYTPNSMYKFGLNLRNVYDFNYVGDTKSHNEVYFTAGFNF